MAAGGPEAAGAPGSPRTAADTTTVNSAATTTVDSAATVATTATTGCTQVCSWDASAPTVVITVLKEDLCALAITATSIRKHDHPRRLGKVILVWVSQSSSHEYSEQLSKVLALLRMHGEAELLEANLTKGSSEWRAQQAVRLKVASVVKSDFYILLDAKDALLRDASKLFFTHCSQGKIFGRYTMDEMPQTERAGYASAASVLQQTPLRDGKWPAMAAPLVMHTDTVIGLLHKLGEPSELGDCTGGLCSALALGASELTLYVVYAVRMADFGCTHSVEERPWDDEVACTIWKPSGEEERKAAAEQIRAVAEGSGPNSRPAFFGVRGGAVLGFAGGARRRVLGDLARLYGGVGLDPFGAAEALANCLDPGPAGTSDTGLVTAAHLH